MGLISLLIALACQKVLSSQYWQFNFYYCHYLKFLKRFSFFSTPYKSELSASLTILLPTLVVYYLLDWLGNGLIYLVVSTLVLIVCFGCIKTRQTYKNYIMSAFRGDMTTCDLYVEQLQQDKHLPNLGFGEILVWLNYRYFIVIMMMFVAFGPAGVLFYRLLVTANEKQSEQSDIASEVTSSWLSKVLFIVDWLPVRIVAFGYMFVGHFSKALPVWLENIFEINKPAYKLLNQVAKQSEDFMVDKDDCTAEPCLLVRLAKRTTMLCLSIIALLTLMGVIN